MLPHARDVNVVSSLNVQEPLAHNVALQVVCILEPIAIKISDIITVILKKEENNSH